ATPLGAAILAGIGVGLYADEEEALSRTYRSGKVYEPNSELTPFYAERFEIYKQLYPATKAINHKLA
ncbi:MAG: hypothetical protein GY794_05735, partial [bacterium]|nr:hypothetical protein [bacterium]